jgi:hypothetical protein
MSKTHRGKGIRTLPITAEGTCPVCGRTRIKLLYDRTLPDGRAAKSARTAENKASPAKALPEPSREAFLKLGTYVEVSRYESLDRSPV